MPIEILMPALSPTMEVGTLAKWHVKEGDEISSGDVIAEIETDKATMEVEAVDEGKIGKILVDEGTEGVSVNVPIAILLEDGEEDGAIAASAPAGGGGSSVSVGAAPEAPAVQTAAAPEAASAESSAASASAPSASAAQLNGNKDQNGARVFISPLARRLAGDNNIDISALAGTGPHGRIVKHDVELAIKNGAAPAKAAPSTALTPAGQTAPALMPKMGMSDEQIMALYDPGSYELVPLDGMRRTIATRLVESKSTIPHFYLTIECELDALLSARKRMNDKAPKEGPNSYKLSVNDFIIKALAMALQEVPHANATWTEQGILRHKSSDIGVAVSVEGGLFTPVLRHAELKTLSELSNEMKDMASRARNKRLAPHEYQGGTTSISNLGMYGIKKFDAVINPPHATILAVGQGERVPRVIDDEVSVVTVMTCTLSCDHRVVDGALGAELLGAFKGFIEDPVSMLV